MPQFEQTIHVDAPVEAVYRAWTRFEEFPEFISNLDQVERVDDATSRWSAGRRHWETKLTEESPNERLGWIVIGGGSAMVALRPEDGGGTRVDLFVETESRKGEPWSDETEVRQDLERFKTLLETRPGSQS